MVYINDSHRLIFIENPKSASTTVRQALQRVLGDSSPRGDPDNAHLTCEQVKELFPDKWDEYLKVSTHREPLSRFLSSIKYIKHSTYYCNTPEQIVNHFQYRDSCVYCTPQSSFINGCDFILNFESLQSDFDSLCEKLGVSPVLIEYSNTSDIQSSSQKIDKDVLIDIYHKYY